MTPKNSNKRGARGQARQNKSSSKLPDIDKQMSDYASMTGSTTVRIPEDYRQRRQNFALVQRPPKGWQTDITWVRLSYDTTLSTSTSVVAENNYYFTISGFENSSSYLAAFDQYCIYSITMGVAMQSSGSTYTTTVQFATAIDYDNITNVGLGGIQAFASYNMCNLSQVTSLVREVKPAIATVVNNSASAFNGNGISRAWLDSAYTNIPHYGIRTLAKASSSSVVLEISFSAIVGLRNNI
jgi:hypothetical protein